MYSRIAGTGSYLPEKVVTNFDLEKTMDTTDEWIRTRTGIERRHIAAEGQTTVDLAEIAARRAIEAAGVTPAEIDFIVFGTTTPDLVFPNCGTLLQARLGARGCPAFSVETACSGFIYALSIADKFVKAGEAKCALVVGAETLSRITNWSDRNTAVLFGDGAGAVVLKPSAEPGIMSTHLHSDGAYKDLLYVDSGVSTGFKIDPATNKVDIGIKMAGSEVFKVAVTKLGGAVDEALARQRPGEVRGQLADPAPGQHPHHRRHGQAARAADGARHRHRAGPRQHLDGLGAAGARCRCARRPREARRPAVAGSLRRRLYLGHRAGPLLSAGCRSSRAGVLCGAPTFAISLSRSSSSDCTSSVAAGSS